MAQSSVEVPYNAYLRVYEPLAAFPEPERSHWSEYAARAAEDRPTEQDEVRQALVDLVPVPPVPVPVHESRDAFVAVVDGVTLVCPWRTRLRSWLALEELRHQFPRPVLDAVLPPVVRVQAEADYEHWRERNPDVRPWIRSSTWHVPVRWFVLFSDDEREFEAGRIEERSDGPDKRRSSPLLRYRTPMVQARRRVARGLKVLRDTMGEGPLIEGLIEVGRWIEDFHPRSLVELDYGGLVHAIDEDSLAEDRSAADVAEGLAALKAEDGARAGQAYERLTERWRGVRELEFAS
ncbi:hypothetical protein AQ490_04150 [Wenjunlia vitaminophila]|uniref:DUF8083 domain-containing protein n=1 Tax=Wenjunlia vitaminophila TaxID=76728 RepID=A0A0T6LRE0_WENVI|nr:hypothetical protein [Wenjunlia vitaminophila]KRV48450.1 hypothetical protein AQ490_04150 [Wenjunlia vitaminophila]